MWRPVPLVRERELVASPEASAELLNAELHLLFYLLHERPEALTSDKRNTVISLGCPS